MKPDEVINQLISRSEYSGRALSANLGRSQSWLRNMTGKDSRIGTVAVIADAVGVDLVLVDRATGATIGRVDPPAQCS